MSIVERWKNYILERQTNKSYTEYHKTSRIVIRVVCKRKKPWWDIFGLTIYKEYDLIITGEEGKGFTDKQMEVILGAIADVY